MSDIFKQWGIYTDQSDPPYKVGDHVIDRRTGRVVEIRARNPPHQETRCWAVYDFVVIRVFDAYNSDLSDPLNPLEVLAHMAAE